MAYSTTNRRQETYFLHARDIELRNHHAQRIYFFAKSEKPGAIDEIPEGYEVVENSRTGLPVLRKVKAHADAAG